jgi:hypothetical protein
MKSKYGTATCQSPLQRGQTRARGIADRSGNNPHGRVERGFDKIRVEWFVSRWLCCWETELDSRNLDGSLSWMVGSGGNDVIP